MFYDENGYERGIEKMIFKILKDGEIIRQPVVDFDYVKFSESKNSKLEDKYLEQYLTDKRFRINLK